MSSERRTIETTAPDDDAGASLDAARSSAERPSSDAPTNAGDAQRAADGKGPLLQRDYWAVIAECGVDPEEVLRVVRRQFCDLAPHKIAAFSRGPGAGELVEKGDRLDVKIRMADRVGVRVVSVEPCSMTLSTLKGHPEAGKITFGAYRNQRGDVVFHIRSRARQRSILDLAGFLVAGDAMQTDTWTHFIERLAHVVGGGVIGEIQTEKRRVSDLETDADDETPTFVARND